MAKDENAHPTKLIGCLEFSWRYGVIGIYKDRDTRVWRLYLPFIRLSLWLDNGQ